MTLTYVLMQNLKRNRMRSALTAISFALPMAVFVAAISLIVALAQVNQFNEKQLRLAVQNRIALVNALPERIRKEIEALDPDRKRLSAICGVRWFGGRVENSPSTIQSLGADADTFPAVFSELDWTQEEKDIWAKDRRASVVGITVAQQYGWKVGDRVTLTSSVPPYLTLEFLVIKVVTTSGRTNGMYLRRDYFEEARRTAGFDYPGCNLFWVKCNSLAALGSLQQEIDARFANTPNETKSMDENAFGASFMQALGDLPGLMQAMAFVVVGIVALVAGNTMMMSFRERTRELAVFKAIGFQSARIFRIVLAESIMLAVLGSAMGIIPIATLLTIFPLSRLGPLPIAAIQISPLAVGISFGIALLVGIVAGIVPAYQALRLNTVSALRRIA
ncbi:MAG: ABC transporter permease [Phycisphaerae bacterium]